MDGQPAIVEICNTHSFLGNDEDIKELSQFPGPLVKGVTHKKTIIEYCENKIRDAIAERRISDVESYILMWELLILLIRQNGVSYFYNCCSWEFINQINNFLDGSWRRHSRTSTEEQKRIASCEAVFCDFQHQQ